MKKFVAAGMLVLAGCASAQTFSDAQAHQLCKLVDPTFINQLPVMLELKKQGLTARAARLAVKPANSFYRGYEGYMEVGIIEVLDSPATTVEEAVQYLEAACVKRVAG